MSCSKPLLPMVQFIRGLPGAGKSTAAAKYVLEGYSHREADHLFIQPDGTYKFDGDLLREAHRLCREYTVNDLKKGIPVVLANTFCTRWEMEFYINYCKENNLSFQVLDLYDRGLTDDELAAECQHGVKASKIAEMRGRYEPDWENSDPTPPWLRK